MRFMLANVNWHGPACAHGSKASVQPYNFDVPRRLIVELRYLRRARRAAQQRGFAVAMWPTPRIFLTTGVAVPICADNEYANALLAELEDQFQSFSRLFSCSTK